MDIDLTKYKNLNPIDDKIIIKDLKKNEKTPGGVYVPESAAGQESKGIVIAVGPGLKEMIPPEKQLLTDGKDYQTISNLKRIGMEVKVGDIVMYNPLVGITIHFEGEELFVQRESELLLIIKS